MFEVIGHRGAAGIAPENTMEGFRTALRLGCPGVELDVHLSADGRAAVIHDARLDRTTDRSGFVRDYTMGELSRMNAGKGQGVPELEDVLKTFNGTDTFLQIELKGDGTEKVVPEIVKDYRMSSRVRYTSFDPEKIGGLSDACGSRCGLIVDTIPENPIRLLNSLGALALHIHRNLIDETIVRLLKHHHLNVVGWNRVVSVNVFEKLLRLGVEGATTDRPDLFIRFLSEKNPTR